MAEPEWTVEARCPHGYSARLPFDALGYLMVPRPGSCDQHRPVTKTVHGVTVDRDFVRPGWYKLWRETRKARRALRDL